MSHKIPIVENILNANDHLAAENRARLDEMNICSVNILASPGAGKTSLILRTLNALSSRVRMGVLEGDTAAVTIDADKISAIGVPAVQINTGGQCHLDAGMIQAALSRIDLAALECVIVENVGNLVCTADFRLGTHITVLIASVPEGDDKPYKYPAIYRGIDALIINKIDLLPYVPFRMDYFLRGVEALNPGLVSFPLSCSTGDGIDSWTNWLEQQILARRRS